jgi:hypothetical protein
LIYDMILIILYYIFNRSLVDTRWQQYITHLHTNIAIPFASFRISKRKANWIDYILRRKCLLPQVTEGKIEGGIEVKGRRGRRRRKLPDDRKERRGYSHLKEDALHRTI